MARRLGLRCALAALLALLCDGELCDWAAVAGNMLESVRGDATLEQVVGAIVEQEYSMRTSCCFFPESDIGCWDPRERSEHADVPEGYIRCCFDDLRDAMRDASWPEWLESEVQHAFRHVPAAIGHGDLAEMQRRVERFELNVHPDNTRPCRFRVRGGRIQGCDLRDACYADADATNDCSYIKALDAALGIIHAVRPLPDGIEFWVSPGERDLADWPAPLFARHFSRATRTVVGLPMEWQLSPWQVQKHLGPVSGTADSTTWASRLGRLIWRGTNSYCVATCDLAAMASGPESMARGECLPDWTPEGCYHSFPTWQNSPRGRLVHLSTYMPDLVDARFTRLDTQPGDPLWRRWMEEANLTAPFMESRDQGKAKYLISLDGTSGQAQQYLQLHSGAAVLIPDSPLQQYLVPGAGAAFQPMENFVPVRHDLSDVAEKLHWLRAHDDEARRIAEQGRQVAEEVLSRQSVLLYVARAVLEYGARTLRGAEAEHQA